MLEGIETVVIRRRTKSGTDEYGAATYTTENITVDRVLVGFDQTDEPVDINGDPQKIGVTLYMPNGTIIEPGDDFIVRGEVFVKDGRAMDWIGPNNGLKPGVVVKVRQSLG